MSSSAPEFPYPGGVAGAEPADPQPGKPGHFAWSRWIKQFVKNLDRDALKTSGGTMTGPLLLSAQSGGTSPAVSVADLSAGLGMVPVGTVVMYGGSSVPGPEWHLCDGSKHGSPALAAVLQGSPDPSATPDLRGRFVVGAGPGHPRGSTGGSAQVTLTANQSGLRSHSHSISAPPAATGPMSANSTHTHTASLSSVAPSVKVKAGSKSVGQETGAQLNGTGVNYLTDNTGDGVYAIDPLAGTSQTAHTHTATIGSANTSHTHTVSLPVFDSATAPAANAAEPHENTPPYYALVYIIKKL
jgi:hypothetical protein